MQRFLVALLVCLSGSAVAADKPVLGVVEFKNESGAAWWGGGVGWELSGMLSNELVATRSFRVVERSKLESVIQEQNLGASGRVSAGTGAQIGKITGADYVVMGTVTAFERDVADSGGGVSFGGISVGGKKDEAYLAVDIRVVNTTTSEIEYVRTIEGRSKGGGIRLGVSRGGFGGSLANEKKTPTGKAIRAALVEISNYLECVMVKQTSRCLDEYEEKEQRRRDSASDALDLDG